MKLDMKKFELAQARTGKTLKELSISKQSIYRARKGMNLSAITLHKIANSLGCDVAEIVEEA